MILSKNFCCFFSRHMIEIQGFLGCDWLFFWIGHCLSNNTFGLLLPGFFFFFWFSHCLLCPLTLQFTSNLIMNINLFSLLWFSPFQFRRNPIKNPNYPLSPPPTYQGFSKRKKLTQINLTLFNGALQSYQSLGNIFHFVICERRKSIFLDKKKIVICQW